MKIIYKEFILKKLYSNKLCRSSNWIKRKALSVCISDFKIKFKEFDRKECYEKNVKSLLRDAN